MNMVLAIAAGGAIGAVLRHYVGMASLYFTGTSFPWGTISVNILGSFIMGALISYFALVWNPAPEIRAFLTVGLLGAFTTFSTFSLDAVTLIERGQMMPAFGYIAVSVLFSIAALFIGMTLTKQFL